MKSRFIARFMAVLLIPALFASCQKDDAPTGSQLGIKISMNRPVMGLKQESVTTASTASLVFNAGYVVVREIVFDGEKNGDDDMGSSISITEEMISTVDLVTGVATPPFTMNIPAGTYSEVSLGVEIQDETARPSVVATGVYTNANGVATPVRFEFNSGEVFEAESDLPVTFIADTPVIANITFDPHAWFATITFAQLDAATRTNGTIIVSETSNQAIFAIVADRLDDLTESDFD